MHPLHSHRAVTLWVLGCMACVVFMVFIGGVTRLTESGLSIVEWKLFSGTFPPLTESAWEAEFAEYKSSPEFTKKNFYFSLSDFKSIYWLEYLHRLMGRITGLVFLLPLVWLWFSMRRHRELGNSYSMSPRPCAGVHGSRDKPGMTDAKLLRRMAFATLLVAAQGTVGWIMVASGLEHDPRVNPLKLALHLSLAFSLFSLLLWTYWQMQSGVLIDCDRRRGAHAPEGCAPSERLQNFTLALLILQIVLGALVAGNDAGLVYNTYPLMDGRLIPPIAWEIPLISNIPLIQFAHRTGAHLLVIVMGMLICRLWPHTSLRPALKWLAATLTLQFLLGVFTLLHAVPVWLGSAHQMAALLLLAVMLRLVFLSKHTRAV